MDEQAKAVQEIAKTSGKAIDAAREAGGFFAEFIRAPLAERFGILTDNLKYQRWENMQDLRARAIEKLKTLGEDAQLRQIPLSVGVPLLEAASIEGDPDLRELWANLIVNFANEGSTVAVHKSFVTVLRELTALEAVILDKIYSLPDAGAKSVMTSALPQFAVPEPVYSGLGARQEPPQPSPEVGFAISNLFRLGCLSPASSWDGGEFVHVVYTTTFGRALFNACKLQRPSGH